MAVDVCGRWTGGAGAGAAGAPLKDAHACALVALHSRQLAVEAAGGAAAVQAPPHVVAGGAGIVPLCAKRSAAAAGLVDDEPRPPPPQPRPSAALQAT